jgi:hypothetical protein
MKIIVTPLDIHPRTPNREPFFDRGKPFVGKAQLVVEPGLVKLDGQVVLYFEKDAARNFVAHNWLDRNDSLWTGFEIAIKL